LYHALHTAIGVALERSGRERQTPLRRIRHTHNETARTDHALRPQPPPNSNTPHQVSARSVLTATEDRRLALHLHSTITPCRHMQASTGRLAPTTHNSSATQDSPTANTHTRRPLPTRLLDNAHTCAARANKSRCPSTTTVHAKGDAEVHEKYQSSTASTSSTWMPCAASWSRN